MPRRAVAFAQRCVHAAASTVRGSCVALCCTKKAADAAHGAAGGAGFACSPAGRAHGARVWGLRRVQRERHRHASQALTPPPRYQPSAGPLTAWHVGLRAALRARRREHGARVLRRIALHQEGR